MLVGAIMYDMEDRTYAMAHDEALLTWAFFVVQVFERSLELLL